MRSHFSLAAFKIVFLCLSFNTLITICFSADCFELVLLRFYGVSYICRLMSFLKSRMFLAIISSNNISSVFSLHSPSGTSIMYILIHLMMYKFIGSGHLFYSFVLSVLSHNNFNCPVLRFTNSLFVLAQYAIEPPTEFVNSVVLFRSRISVWFLFGHYCFFVDILIFLKYCFRNFL